MKELIKFLKPYTKESILGPLFKLTEATFELFVPLVVAAIVTNGIEKNDNAYILKMGALMVLLALIGLICALTAQFFAAKAATGFAAGLREAIFRNIQSRTYSELEEQGTGALITRITSDVNQLQTGVNLFLRLFLRSPFIVFGAVIMAFTVNVKGALIFTICVPILFLVVFAVLLKSIPLYKKVQNSLDTVTVKTRENITGVRVIRAFNCDDEESEAFDKEIDTLKSLQLLAGRVTAIMNPATFLIVNVATLAVLYVGATQVDAGIIERGALIALLNYMAQILVELIKLANLIITMTKSVACGDRIANLLKEKKEDSAEENTLTEKENRFEKIDSIEFESVSFKYPKEDDIKINRENLKTFAGEINGENKESLTAEKTASVLTRALRDAIGIVPQTAVLFAGTVEDNLRWGKNDATKEDMDLSLKRAEAYDFVYGKKGELKAEVTEGGKNFSGGQRQRLSIARAFIKEPEILILDDSTSALDFVTEKKVRAGIREIAEDSICFVVSQRAAGIMDADKILVLDDGCLAGCGRHEELIKSCEVYREIYKSQFPEEEI